VNGAYQRESTRTLLPLTGLSPTRCVSPKRWLFSAGDQWAEVATAGQLDAWPEQHPRSVIALFSRFARAAAGLHRAGHGSRNLLSGGL